MKILNANLILFAILILLTGFSDIFCQNFLNQDSKTKTLCIYRKKRIPGSGNGIGLTINSTEIKRIKNASRLIIVLNNPGSILEVSSYNKINNPSSYSSLRIPIEESNIFYIETACGDVFDSNRGKPTDSYNGGIVFVLQNPKIGKEEFYNNQLFNQNRIDTLLNPIINYQYVSQKLLPNDTLIYRSKKILDWNDFKCQPSDPKSSKDLSVYYTFVTFPKKVNVWTGIIKVESYGAIRRDLSWVKSELQTPELLDYIQIKYDISEIYAKKVEYDINSQNINAGNRSKLSGIIETYLNKMQSTFNMMDTESNYGQKSDLIEQWKSEPIEIIMK
jgi:hypothetical protein